MIFKKYLVWEWKKPLGVPENPYAYRWRLDFYFFSLRIHYWLCSDDNRAYHSHPINFISFILKGNYINHYLDSNNQPQTKKYNRFSFIKIKRNHKHWVEITCKPTITLLLTWGSPQRWAFWDTLTLKKKNRDKYFLEHGNHICES